MVHWTHDEDVVPKHQVQLNDDDHQVVSASGKTWSALARSVLMVSGFPFPVRFCTIISGRHEKLETCNKNYLPEEETVIFEENSNHRDQESVELMNAAAFQFVLLSREQYLVTGR